MTTKDLYPSYFLQNPDWLKFWKKASGPGHNFFLYENDLVQAYVQEYPWHLSQKLWYIPKGPIIKQVEASKLNNTAQQDVLSERVKALINHIISEAKSQNVAYLKFDLDDTCGHLLGISDNQELLEWSNENLIEGTVGLSNRKIQYLKSTVNDISDLPVLDSNQNLLGVFTQTKFFWDNTNEKIRRYSRKSLKLYENGNWQVSTEKSDVNFEAFWQVHYQTTIRQGFSTQTKDYLYQMCMSDFGRLIVIRDKEGQPHCVWLGIDLDQTLYYICGGNTELSFAKHAQYLLHIAAIRLARSNNLDYYDMGGYEPNTGYGQFKEGYKGKIREFLGPLDIVFKPKIFKIINSLIKIKNNWKNVS